MNALVIVESPSKAKTIEKYLGKGFTVKASKGHIVDLPKSGLAVDVENKFKPEYSVSPGKNKIIRELKQALKGKEKLIIAVDPDREGEAIGWHVANKLGLVDLRGKRKQKDIGLERIVFTEITKEAVTEALNSPRELDLNLLNAQQARRVLDRLVGYKLSPLLWKKIRFGLSAGRVQSVAVKFIVDREEERERFKPEEYWRITAYTDKDGYSAKKPEKKVFLADTEKEEKLLPDNSIKFELVKINGKDSDLANDSSAENIVNKLLEKDWIINAVEAKSTRRNPKPPFTTSTLQQTAANWFGFSAKRTMVIAQKLYENGYITYMRTDSTNMSQQAVSEARAFLEKNYGVKYLPAEAKAYKTKAKVAQEAHEAIRPSHFTTTPDSLSKLEPDEVKLYRLIWQRALAAQANAAEIEALTIKVLHNDNGQELEFRANGQRVIFPGYLAIYPEKVSEVELPALKSGDRVSLLELHASQHFTLPPARFSEATLIKELEKYGIGRPSTYAPIISTIQQRGYVEKEGGYFKPTDVARVVIKLLAAHFEEIVDKDFTAKMEDGLDDIANGDLDWEKYLKEFYEPFASKLTTKDKEINREDFTVLGGAPDEIKCPTCGSKMIIKLSRYGRFYSCGRFPDCEGMLSIDGKTEEDLQKEAQSDEFTSSYEDAPKTEDGRDYLLKTGKYGKFWAHPDYPKVKDAQPLVYKPAKLRELYGDAPQTDDGREFIFRTGKFGKFWAHPDYPKVKQTVRIKEPKKQEGQDT